MIVLLGMKISSIFILAEARNEEGYKSVSDELNNKG